MKIECNHCNTTVDAAPVGEFVKEFEYDWLDNLKYTLLKCTNCTSPIVIQQSLVLEFNEEISWGNPEIIFPDNSFQVNSVIPSKLRASLLESIKCLRSEAYTASVIMCRRTLEGFCLLKGAKEKNLLLSLEKLKDEGELNPQLFEWANQLRISGNEAAHDIDVEFIEDDAIDIVDFTIAILDFSYSFKDKFDKFQARRATKE